MTGTQTDGVRVRAASVTKQLPDQALLRSMFRYDALTGKLFRNALTSADFPECTDPRGPAWAASSYNAQCAGNEAFTFADRQGYYHGKVKGVKYQAHRIIWKMEYGVDPPTIDHINGDPSDNRLANLRAATVAENSRNYPKPRGTSQYRGVSWVQRDQAWAAQISNGEGGKVSLGHHVDEVSAARAYDEAAKRLHGEFATLNFPEAIR